MPIAVTCVHSVIIITISIAIICHSAVVVAYQPPVVPPDPHDAQA